MSQETKYKWGDRQPDGSTALLKNGKPTFCPKSQLGFVPGVVEGQLYPFRPACFKECPYMMNAILKQNSTDEGKPGYTINCMDRPLAIFIEESDNKKKSLLIP